MTAIVIEDDVGIRRLLAAAVAGTEFKLVETTTATDGLAAIAHAEPDVVMLDLVLPDMDGIELIRELRTWCQTPVIVVSGEGEVKRKVAALEAGADDYVTKPFSAAELLARMRAAVRRSESPDPDCDTSVTQVGEIEIDHPARKVKRSGKVIHLTPTEFRLLCLLAKHPGRVLTHRQILTEVWGHEYSGEPQYLRLYIGYLRKKLELDARQPRFILTEHGVGYRLAD